jgi:hypothetical protein
MTEYKIYKCNRCGFEQRINLINEKKGWSSFSFKPKLFINSPQEYIMLKDNVSACDLDLCPACLDTFKAWYKSSEKEE